MNRHAADGSGETDYEVIATMPVDEVNRWWKEEKGYDNPPYRPGTEINVIELTQDQKFVRVYDGKESKMYGGWLMRAEDIAGLTPQQIRDLYALPSTPKYICDVVISAGTTMRSGIANEVDGWGAGGGTQYDLIGQVVGTFENERLL